MIATLITTNKAEFFFRFVKVSIKCSLINRWQLSKLLTKQVTEIHTNLPNRARRSRKAPQGANRESPQTASTPTNHESGEYPNAAQKRTDDPTRADNRENTASTDTGRPKAREAYEGRQTRRRPSEQDTETASAPDTTTATTDTGADHRARGTEANNETGRGATAEDTAPTTGRAETKEEKDITNPNGTEEQPKDRHQAQGRGRQHDHHGDPRTSRGNRRGTSEETTKHRKRPTSTNNSQQTTRRQTNKRNPTTKQANSKERRTNTKPRQATNRRARTRRKKQRPSTPDRDRRSRNRTAPQTQATTKPHRPQRAATTTRSRKHKHRQENTNKERRNHRTPPREKKERRTEKRSERTRRNSDRPTDQPDRTQPNNTQTPATKHGPRHPAGRTKEQPPTHQQHDHQHETGGQANQKGENNKPLILFHTQRKIGL